jgi:hypothetical protein
LTGRGGTTLIREGDTEGLAAHANRFATAETDAAMEAAPQAVVSRTRT